MSYEDEDERDIDILINHRDELIDLVNVQARQIEKYKHLALYLKPYFENNPLDLALIKLDSCLKGFDKGWNDFSEVNS
jgi:hypothetical protein